MSPPAHPTQSLRKKVPSQLGLHSGGGHTTGKEPAFTETRMRPHDMLSRLSFTKREKRCYFLKFRIMVYLKSSSNLEQTSLIAGQELVVIQER